MWGAADLDGRPRILNGTVDMGAYEYEHGPPVVLYVDHSVPEPGDGTSWETAFKKIQEGIDAAKPGQTVTVADGIYVGGILFKGKNILLQSTDPLDPLVVANSIIDGYKRSSAVTFAGTEHAGCILSGFTIRNGMSPFGAGIFGNGTHATIQNNLIVNNTAAGEGAGFSNCHGIIRGNVITRNSAETSGGLGSCNGTIRNNVMTENSVGKSGGGLIYCNEVIQGSTIAKNSAGEDGGGLYWCDALIQNNTIVANSAGGSGGGLSECQEIIINCIIWGNTAPEAPQIHRSITPSYSCIENWTDGGEANIAEDPAFRCEEEGDFRLLPSSPCIDRGSDSPPGLPDTDVAGMQRILYGGTNFAVDIGAHEYCVNHLAMGPAAGEATLTWSSLLGKTYSVFYSDDLLTWHLVEPNVPSAGIETTSWLDDVTKTGVLLSETSRRFYRIHENP